jgi:predicted O-linked N-acetylglucosamine transferase (SPINDLY family)
MMKQNYDHLMLYSQVDIALDCFPYNGTTTTCEALIMGCPVLTILGDRHASRVSASLLTHVGRSEWIAKNEDEFVSIGAALASDANALAALRMDLRPRMMASPLCDAARMEREMLDAINLMWGNWCSGVA